MLAMNMFQILCLLGFGSILVSYNSKGLFFFFKAEVEKLFSTESG